MNVASLELCRKLYELSGWHRTEFLWVAPPLNDTDYEVVHTRQLYELKDNPAMLGSMFNSTPAYDLGYLIEMLPANCPVAVGLDYCFAAYYDGVTNTNPFHARADTPEDAACKLAIELFKKRVLTREVA